MVSETYKKILAAARRLFVEKGYTASSMREIACAAGIGKATIYHHFPDKPAIAKALLRANMSAMDDTLRLVGAEMDPRRRIEKAAELSIGFLFESADIIQVVRRELPGGRDQMQEGYQVFFSAYLALLTDAIRRGSEAGIFRAVDPGEAARVLMTMIQGTFAMAFMVNERAASPQQAAAGLLGVFFLGLDKR